MRLYTSSALLRPFLVSCFLSFCGKKKPRTPFVLSCSRKFETEIFERVDLTQHSYTTYTYIPKASELIVVTYTKVFKIRVLSAPRIFAAAHIQYIKKNK